MKSLGFPEMLKPLDAGVHHEFACDTPACAEASATTTVSVLMAVYAVW